MPSFIHIRKDRLKFSSAHMTVFPDGTKESLHGHNYQVELEVQIPSIHLADMFPFADLKSKIAVICSIWDEKVLLAERCPFLKNLKSEYDNVFFELCGKQYSLPRDELVLLPLENVTSEGLAKLFAESLVSSLEKKILSKIVSLRLRIDEISGQGGSYVWSSEHA